ncbi:DUF938 domain-containing protein [Methylobacterium planeticum]|uniref:DUF938 domain-containing protein n=1 Tax=Methylobacterium planeticum TaxID=2615211 RepID=A0A6N6MKM9_9HYPH|nr:DUF938 domain-containing protein [Methylobacterium planeticum]KAB1070547.1 DUF938 domain-containing protein [Methylobacterium planeticum]
MSDEIGEEALHAPATLRNRDPILAVLARVLPPAGLVLEVAAGTGEHAVHFARGLPHLAWCPSDPDARALRSIAAYRARARLPNLMAPLALDASAAHWPVPRADAVVAINLVHIAPWPASEGLMAGAARVLAPGGALVLYGPFREPDVPTAPGNTAFDADLRGRDPDWGLRDRAAMARLAEANDLALTERVAMPANNLILVFRKR